MIRSLEYLVNIPYTSAPYSIELGDPTKMSDTELITIIKGGCANMVAGCYELAAELLLLSLDSNNAIRTFGNNEEKRYNVKDYDEIGNISYTYETYPYFNYLELSNLKKNGNKWSVVVTNTSEDNIVLEYNSKLCFEDDAKNWTGLKDIKKISLSPGESTTIIILENWFATTMALSYVNNSRIRVITYANNLNFNGQMSIMNNVLA